MERETKYEDIDPTFEWKKDEDQVHDTLELHVEGFNKEQLKVQLNSHGSLLVNGERPPNELMKLNGSRFRKEFKLSKQQSSTASGAVTAKLSHGILRIKVLKSATVTEMKSRSDGNPINCVDHRIRTMLLSAAVIVAGFGAYLWLSYKYSVSLSQDHNSVKNQTVLDVIPLPI